MFPLEEKDMEEKKKKGGRKRNTPGGVVRVSITVPVELREKLTRLGGSTWITKKLKEARE